MTNGSRKTSHDPDGHPISRRPKGPDLQCARQIAFDEFREEAMRLGGNSVVGIDRDYELVRVSLA